MCREDELVIFDNKLQIFPHWRHHCKFSTNFELFWGSFYFLKNAPNTRKPFVMRN